MKKEIQKQLLKKEIMTEIEDKEFKEIGQTIIFIVTIGIIVWLLI